MTDGRTAFSDMEKHHAGWAIRRRENLQKALQAEALAIKWHHVFSSGHKDAVPLPFRLYLIEAAHRPSTSYGSRVLLGWLLIRLFDTCPDLSNIYQGRSLPTPRYMLDAVMAAREEYHVLVELSQQEISKKAVPLFCAYAQRCAEALPLDYDGPNDALELRDDYIADRAIDIMWDKGFFHPVGYFTQQIIYPVISKF